MQDNEAFAHHVKKNQVSRPRSAETSLITLERSQKLDLLIHLISNLRQSLVICGPNGIGKTTLLDELVVQKKELWSVVAIKASGNVSLESIQDELFRFLKQKDTEYGNQVLSSILSVLNKQNQKIVVIIDDAGELVPGLISSLIQYAEVNSCLRIVFSLTHDELHLKSSSDGAIDDCHIIEIPPLAEKQCGLFLQLLSGQPGAVVAFNAINERMIEKLYRETHGIPGKIVAELPKLSNFNSAGNYKWITVVVISALIAIGSSIFISNEPDNKPNIEETKTALVLQEAEVVEISSPVIYPEINEDINKVPMESPVEDKEADMVSVQPTIKIEQNNNFLIEKTENASNKKNISPKQELKEEPPVSSKVLEKEAVEKLEKNSGETVAEDRDRKVTVTKKVTDSPAIKQKLIPVEEKKAEEADKPDKEKQWVLAQPAKSYTIQLMVLSSRKSVLVFFNKNSSLKDGLRFYQISKKGQKKYVLIYGSFKNSAMAAKKMKSLPSKYRKSWVRKFETLQKDIKQ